jgi:archaellin
MPDRTLLSRFIAAIWRLLADEAGFGAAPVAMLSLVTGATLLAGSVMGAGTLASDRLEATVHDSLDRAGGTLEVRGSVVARATAAPAGVTEIDLTLDMAGLGGPVVFDHDAGANRAVVSITTATTYDADVPYVATQLSGDGDNALGPGELFLIKIDGSSLPAGLKAGQRFTIEVTSGTGGVLSISRTLPFALDPVNALP